MEPVSMLVRKEPRSKGMTKVISMHVEGGSVRIHGGEVAIYFTG